MSLNQGLTKEIWLYLLNSGGRSTSAEIVSAVTWLTPNSAAWLLRSMVTSGHIVRYEKTETSRVTYGVTDRCKVPNQVHLSELPSFWKAKAA